MPRAAYELLLFPFESLCISRIAEPILTSQPAKMSFFKKIKAELREMLNDDDDKDKKKDQGAGRKKRTSQQLHPP